MLESCTNFLNFGKSNCQTINQKSTLKSYRQIICVVPHYMVVFYETVMKFKRAKTFEFTTVSAIIFIHYWKLFSSKKCQSSVFFLWLFYKTSCKLNSLLLVIELFLCLFPCKFVLNNSYLFIMLKHI